MARPAGWLLLVALVTGCPPGPGMDAGVTDAGRADAAVPDASAPDAARGDAGLPDAAAADAGIPDAALPDAWAPDAAVPDAAIPDSARPDAWAPDAWAPDAWAPDAWAPDAWMPDAAPAADAAADLGWPWDAAVPSGCPVNPVDPSGTPWDGWANYQFPESVVAGVGVPGGPVYGQVWQDSVTTGAGAAAGWEAQLLVGPLGTVPTTDGRCWETIPASFNADVGNNDEYRASVTPLAPGLRGMFFRFRPPGGAWRYGDRNGSTDGLQASQAGVLMTADTGAQTRPLVLVSLNLRCRKDPDWVGAWPARLPLVARALARVNPDLVAFQEDCLADGGTPQSEEIRELLGPLVNRGYDYRWVNTHRAFDTWDEGVSVMSAHPVEAAGVLDLQPSVMGRKALWVDVTVRGRPLRVYSTHLEVDDATARDAMRAAEAQAILDSRPAGRDSVVMGDFNAEPAEEVHGRFRTAGMVDAWARANPGLPGLSFPVDNPDVRIDYVYLPAAVAPAIQGARQLDEHEGSTWLSDHRGVAVLLQWP